MANSDIDQVFHIGLTDGTESKLTDVLKASIKCENERELRLEEFGAGIPETVQAIDYAGVKSSNRKINEEVVNKLSSTIVDARQDNVTDLDGCSSNEVDTECILDVETKAEIVENGTDTSIGMQDEDHNFCLKHPYTEETIQLKFPEDLECVDDDRGTIPLMTTNFFDENVQVRNESVHFKPNFLRKTSDDEEYGAHWISRNKKTFEKVPISNINKLLAESGSAGSILDELPDELVVKIFSYLTTKDLCQRVARVCRKWRQISLDHSLWKSLDFSSYPKLCNLNLLWVIRRAPLLKRLVLSGRMNISRAVVAIVTESCPMLQEIDFGFCDDLNSDMLQCLPDNCLNLRKINIEGCDALDNKSLKYFVKCKRLSHLNLSHCMFIQDSSITFLAKGLPKIESINMDGISFLTDSSIAKQVLTTFINHSRDLIPDGIHRHKGEKSGVTSLVAQHYLHLIEVELDGAEISDVGIQQLSRCKQLRLLSVSFCECLTDLSLEYILDLKHLENLRLRKGSDFTAEGLSSFFKAASLSHLQFLNLSECSSVTDQVVLDITQACGSHLKQLALSWCWFITDAGLVSIVDHCCNVENLDLLGIDRIYGECLVRVPEEMTKLRYLDLSQCNKILDNLIVDMVRRKRDLRVINYYGEEFIHN